MQNTIWETIIKFILNVWLSFNGLGKQIFSDGAFTMSVIKRMYLNMHHVFYISYQLV